MELFLSKMSLLLVVSSTNNSHFTDANIYGKEVYVSGATVNRVSVLPVEPSTNTIVERFIKILCNILDLLVIHLQRSVKEIQVGNG